jgi:polar amino acid transport system substrate-binding protein
MVESPEKGVFIELTREIIKRTGEKFEIAVYPPNRTVGGFHAGEIDAFFPALDVLIQKEVAPSSEIYVKRDFGFVAKDQPAIGSLEDLKGKTIGITQGYPYSPDIVKNPDLKLIEAQSDEINVKNLVNGRIDVFIVEEKTGLKAVEKAGAEGVHYDKDSPLSEQKVYYAFQNDQGGKALADKFSTALEAMKADGTFAKIMATADNQK